jgi:hypothetical protein
VIEAKDSKGIPLFLEMLFEYDESTKVILIHSSDDKLACQNMPCIEKILSYLSSMFSLVLVSLEQCAQKEKIQKLFRTDYSEELDVETPNQ